MTVLTTNMRLMSAVRWRMTLTRGYGGGPGGEPAGCGGPYPVGGCRRDGGRDDMAALAGCQSAPGVSRGIAAAGRPPGPGRSGGPPGSPQLYVGSGRSVKGIGPMPGRTIPEAGGTLTDIVVGELGED